MILTVETLKQIAKHFTEVYSEEVKNNEVTSEMISEWWGMTCDQYGYSQKTKRDVELRVIEAVMFEKVYTVIDADDNEVIKSFSSLEEAESKRNMWQKSAEGLISYEIVEL